MLLSLRIQTALIILSITAATHCDFVKSLDPIGEPITFGLLVGTVNWCACNFLAAGGQDWGGGIIGIYRFDQATETLSSLGAPTNIGTIVNSLSWCPSCSFLVVGGVDWDNTGIIQVYSFDPSHSPVLNPAGAPISLGGSIADVDWCSSCTLLAAGGTDFGWEHGIIQVYGFDPEHPFGLVDLGGTFTVYTTSMISSIKWCNNDCRYLAAGGKYYLGILNFDPNTKKLTEAFSLTLPGITISAVGWCEDCKYLAAGGHNETSGLGYLLLYHFDQESTPSLSLVKLLTSDVVTYISSLAWCQGCDNLALSGYAGGGNEFLQLYHFDKTCGELSLIQTQNGLGYAVSWCSSCSYLAAGGVDIAGSIQLYKSEFPSLPTYNFSDNIDWCQNCSYFAVGGLNDSGGLTQLYKSEFQPLPTYNFSDNIDWCQSCSYFAVGGLNNSGGLTQLYKSEFPPTAPSNLHAQKMYHRFPSQIDIINKLCWDAVTNAVSYNVYADEDLNSLLAIITTTPYCYSQHNIRKGKLATYYVTAVDTHGLESSPAVITI